MFTKTLSLRARLAAACVALTLTSFATTAGAVTAEQRAACTPDVFRLCSSDIPNVSAIISCMKRQRSKLSPACAAVFQPPRTATRSLTSAESF